MDSNIGKNKSRDVKRVVLIGATLTGNRGAESMLQAAVQRISDFTPHVTFSLLSLYPIDDVEENQNDDLEIVACPPMHLVLVVFPVALIIGVLKRLHLPYRWVLFFSKPVREMVHSDLIIDLSGISFVDGRGNGILLYNVLVVLLPCLLGRKLLKYSQALGPFERPLNRFLARKLLPTVSRIATRGRITHKHLQDLGIPESRLTPCADAAFAMRIGPAARKWFEGIEKHRIFQRPVVGIAPSSVVYDLCAQHGIDYTTEMASFISCLAKEKGYNVVLFAHSARKGRKSFKNNDLPICRNIYNLMNVSDSCYFIDECLNAEQLRVLIGSCQCLVTSRFHAMISSLCMRVPTLLIGWSHKYAEVLDDFNLESYALDYKDLSKKSLFKMFDKVEREKSRIRDAIEDAFFEVEQSSLQNARIACQLLGVETENEADCHKKDNL